MSTAPNPLAGPVTVALAAGLPMLAETLGVALTHRGHRVLVVPCPLGDASTADLMPADAAVGILVCGPDDTAIGRDVARFVQATTLPWLVVLDRDSDSGRERALWSGAADVLTAAATLDQLEGAVLRLAADSVAADRAGSLPAG